MFRKAIDERIDFYIEQNIDMPNYTTPNSGERLKAIEATIKGAEKK
jgi:hypothetical protein